MQPIRRKIKLVIFLLAAAIAVSTLICARGGLGADEPGACGTISYPEPPLSKAESAGKAIYQYNCASCHAIDKEATGPALIGAVYRSPYPTFIKSLLLNPEKTFKKSVYARQLQKKYDNTQHPIFSKILSDEDVQNVIAYISYKAPAGY